MGAWIELVADEDAEGGLKEQYDSVRTPHGTVDAVMLAHGLRPHTLAGHVGLYRSVLHHDGNVLPVWFLECVATYTSLLNGCDYSVSHHWTNARNLIDDAARSDQMFAALRSGTPADAFMGKHVALLEYARRLTVAPGGFTRETFDACRRAGASDGEILEVNQVCGYFNYSNRLINGLGVTAESDIIGFYRPST